MPNYVVLSDWTDDEGGVGNAGSTVEWADRVTRLAQKYGARVAQSYWAVWPHDFFGIVEAPDHEAANAFALEISSAGLCAKSRCLVPETVGRS